MDKKPVINVMIDLETLGLKPGRIILALGAACFGTDEPFRFYAQISQTSCAHLGLTADPNTLAWWSNQTEEAQREALYGTQDITAVLQEFAEFLAEIEDDKYEVRVWGNAASFDLKILEAAYIACGIPVPWKYYNEMCFRTLKNLNIVPEPEFIGVKHYALADADHQAHWAEQILDKIASIHE